MKHTPEPWYVAHHQFFYAAGHLLVGQTACPPALSDDPVATQAINADRIAACVNALHDMDNKEIDNIRAWAHGAGIGTALAMKDKAIGEYQLLVSDMEKQRDELQSRVDFLNDQNSAQQEQHDRLAALNAELVETMRHIIAADKTCYEYRGKHAENAAGDKPKAGSRWATPRELAQAAIAKAGETK